jgi:hypothetical protein
MSLPEATDSLSRAWNALMSGDLNEVIRETQWGSGDHRRLCALAAAVQRHHDHHLHAWMDTAHLALCGKSPREALKIEDSRGWEVLRRSLGFVDKA